MLGLLVVTRVSAAPTGVRIAVMGASDVLHYTPPDRDRSWLERSAWLLRWTTPADAGAWIINSTRYGPHGG